MTDTESAITGTPNTVLVVDDNATARWLLSEILSTEGYVVIEAASADQALIILNERPEIRAVVTDIEMPGTLNGLELARRIVAGMPGIAVLLTSGRYLPVTETLPPSTRFMPKPWQAGEILQHLEILFASSKSAPGMATDCEAERRSQKNLREK